MQRPWRRKLKTDWTTRHNSSSSKLNGSSLGCSICQWPSDPFSFETFLSPIRCLSWLCCVLMSASKLSWIISGLGDGTWVGVGPFKPVFVFSSVVASVGNGSTKAAIFFIYTVFRLLMGTNVTATVFSSYCLFTCYLKQVFNLIKWVKLYSIYLICIFYCFSKADWISFLSINKVLLYRIKH